MPTVQYRPTSPGRRFQTGYDFAEITKAKPEASLTEPLTPSRFVLSANQSFMKFMFSVRPLWMMPARSQPMMCLTPADMRIFEQATPAAPTR